MEIFDSHPETEITKIWHNIDKYLQRALEIHLTSDFDLSIEEKASRRK